MSSRGDRVAIATTPTRNRKSRGKGLRTRSGCHRCKARRVKCDEASPACSACQKAGHHCEYPAQSSRPRDRLQDSSASTEPGQQNSPLQTVQGISHRSDLGCTNGASDQGTENAQVQNHVPPRQPAEDRVAAPYSLDTAAFETSPDSAFSGWGNVSAEAAPLKWFGLVAIDAAYGDDGRPYESLHSAISPAVISNSIFNSSLPELDADAGPDPPGSLLSQSLKYDSRDEISLSANEAHLLQHFVLDISSWIDATDPDHSFANVVPQMALHNRGVMNAILALSARHLSIVNFSNADDDEISRSAETETLALQYYHQTLSYLQQEMRNMAFLTSEELLATVLLVSTYEMIDGSGRGWERHLKGVFWIQRSQLIHGESGGLKGRIWWAWLRQDIWVAYREQRKILSYYHLTRDCSELGFWELVDRAIWLLGQCVNYASLKEQRAGEIDIQGRIEKSSALWAQLETWRRCFAESDRRLPAARDASMAFEPIWINPPAAALAMQVHHFSKILLLEHTPAMGGLKDLIRRQSEIQTSTEVICGVACCVFDVGVLIVSTMCVFAAGFHIQEPARQDHVLALLRGQHRRTGWPQYDLSERLLKEWKTVPD